MASEKQCVNPSVHPQPCQVCGPVGTSDKVSEAQNRRENILDDTLDYDDRAYWLDEHVAAVRAEQPPAIGHVARCHCLEVALGCDPRTDPRCKPGLLREAEVRLEVALAYVGAFSAGDKEFIAGFIEDTRAEVERLRGQS